MSFTGINALPELDALASQATTLGTAARAEIDAAKLHLYRELQKRDFRPSSEEPFDRRKAKEPVLDFTRLVWLTLARDKVRRSGSSRVDRNAISEETLRVFLEEEWLSRYLAAETNNSFTHLVDTIPEGTPEFWRRFEINRFLDLQSLAEELELQVRVEVLRAEPGDQQTVEVALNVEAPAAETSERQVSLLPAELEPVRSSRQANHEYEKLVFSRTLARILKQKKKTQEEVAEKAGVNATQISKWVTGAILPRGENMSLIINALGFTPEQFEDELRVTEKRLPSA